MPRLSSKSPRTITEVFAPTAGVNYGNAPVDLKRTELARCMNLYYPKQSTRLTVRPGFECVTDAANKLPNPILNIKPYYNGTDMYLLGVSGGKLYQMTKNVLEGTSPAWAEVGDLTDSTTKPSLLGFNGLALIADGGAAVRCWDGSTYGSLTNSPKGCTALLEARNRVVANSSDYDYVDISAPEFPGTDWAYNTGNLKVAAGFGDGVPVNGLALGPGGLDVIISKRNDQQGKAQIRRLLMADSSPANWMVSDPTDENAGAQNAHGITSAFNRTVFFDDVGIKALAATDSYAEIEVDPYFGRRINKTFSTFNAQVNEIAFLPTIGALMFLLKSHPQPYLYFPRNNAFCPWRMSGAVINSACTIDGMIYLAADDGNLYRMNEDMDTDEVQPGEARRSIQSYGRTKKIVASGRDMVLKRTTIAMTPIKSGPMVVRAIKNDEASQVQVGEFNIEDGADLLGLAVEPLAEATGKLGAGGAEPTQQSIYGGPRSKGLQIEWYGNGSRYEIEYITAEIAGPLGG